MGLLPRIETTPDYQTYQANFAAAGADNFWVAIQPDEVCHLLIDVSVGNAGTATVTWFYTDDPGEVGVDEPVLAGPGHSEYFGRYGQRRARVAILGNTGTFDILAINTRVEQIATESSPVQMLAAGPAITRSAGDPDVDGLFTDVSQRNFWEITGHDANDTVLLAWRLQVLRPIEQWPTQWLDIDHLVDDAVNVQINLNIYDTLGVLQHTAALAVDVAWQREAVTKTDGTIEAGTWTPGELFTVEIEVILDDGDHGYVTTPRVLPA